MKRRPNQDSQKNRKRGNGDAILKRGYTTTTVLQRTKHAVMLHVRVFKAGFQTTNTCVSIQVGRLQNLAARCPPCAHCVLGTSSLVSSQSFIHVVIFFLLHKVNDNTNLAFVARACAIYLDVFRSYYMKRRRSIVKQPKHITANTSRVLTSRGHTSSCIRNESKTA